MDDLIDSGAEAVSDPDGALMVVSAINSIIGGEGGVRSNHIITFGLCNSVLRE